MNNVILKPNTRVTVGNNPMVLLPLDIYEKITKGLEKLNSKILLDIKKRNFLAVASISSLSKDWLREEEEKAWQNL